MLGARETQTVRACRYRFQRARPEAADDLADRFRGGSEVRCHFHAGAFDQRLVARSAGGRAPQRHPLVNDLIEWMKRERAKLSRHNELAKAMDYMLKRIHVFTRFLEDGRICLSNNAAERELRGIALGRKSWLFAGSDRGGERAAIMLRQRRAGAGCVCARLL